jgi:hypothetical protein
VLIALIGAAMVAGCAGETAPAEVSEVPADTPVPPPTAVEDEAAVEESDETIAATDAPQEPEAAPTSPLDPVREVVEPRATNGELAGATLYQLMSIPVPGGESLVFHFEDELGAAQIGCSGHALALLADGGTYELGGIAVNCGLSAVDDPVTFFLSQGIDLDGHDSTVVYGEIYDSQVVAIRVPYQGGEVNATIIGGGFQALLPPDAAGIVVRAYDSAGDLLFEGEPES